MPKRIALAILSLSLLAAPAMAQDEVLAVYDQGSLSFDYDQWPFGSYNGSFSAEGAFLDSLLWGDTQLMAAGGRLEVKQDTTAAWAYGAIYNPDTSVDVSVLFVRGLGALTPGYHPIDLADFMTMYAYFDDVSEFTIPTDSTDIQVWLDSVVAAHKFFGSSGGIQVDAVNDSSFAGSFSGQMIDMGSLMIIAVSGGLFDMSGGPVVTAAPASFAPFVHGSYPNPFNPKTRIRFALPAAGELRVSVHDLAGRRVALLEEGWAPAGERVLDWDAEGLPAGLYLYRIESAAGVASGKLVLLP